MQMDSKPDHRLVRRFYDGEEEVKQEKTAIKKKAKRASAQL